METQTQPTIYDQVVVIDGMTYRFLPPDEWERLRPIFDENDWFLPPKELATCVVAEDRLGAIIHLQMLQLVLHAEPRWTDPAYEGTISYSQSFNMLKGLPKRGDTLTPGFVAIATSESMEKMMKRAGFKQVPGTIWVKEFEK